MWLPQALTPQAGAIWTAVDDVTAIVTVMTPAGYVGVSVSVDADGRLASLSLQRWNDSVKPPRNESFGGELSGDFLTPDGVRVAGSGTVGWRWDSPEQDDHEFFRYFVTSALHRP